MSDFSTTPYKRGRDKEYRIIKNLKRSNDWDIIQRTAGSHSPIDIIAISKLTRVIKFIQSKPESMPETEKNKIRSDLDYLNGGFRAEFEIL
jgi:hypothetical protein